MFLRIDLRQPPKFEVPREVQITFELLTAASPPPPPQITLRVIRRGGVSSGRSRSFNSPRNQALLSRAPLSLAPARFCTSSLSTSLYAFIRIALTDSQLTASLTSWHPYRY